LPTPEEFLVDCNQTFDRLFAEAWSKSPLDTIYTLVRVDGMADGSWDPLEESMGAFDDYREIIEQAIAMQNTKRLYRQRLLYYCHLIESSAPYEIIKNLTLCRIGKQFHLRPFSHLYRKGKDSFSSIPPSVKSKVNDIKSIEDQNSMALLSTKFADAIDDQIRNSFFHSDYCLTDTNYRWTESGPAKQISIEELDLKLSLGFAFFSAFFAKWKAYRIQLGQGKKVHKMPNYETLELLVDEDGLLNGFKVHFSNGHIATFKRSKHGVTAENLSFDNEGAVGYFVGMTDELNKVWVWNKKLVDDWNALP